MHYVTFYGLRLTVNGHFCGEIAKFTLRRPEPADDTRLCPPQHFVADLTAAELPDRFLEACLEEFLRRNYKPLKLEANRPPRPFLLTSELIADASCNSEFARAAVAKETDLFADRADELEEEECPAPLIVAARKDGLS